MRTSAARGKKREEEILDAAAAVFAERGYHGASTSDIAARLGIRQGSVYYYFRSKEQALERVCLAGVQGFVERIETIAAADPPLSEGLREVVTGHVGAIVARRDSVIVFLRERRHVPRARRRRINAQARRYERALETMLGRAVARSEARIDLDCRMTALHLIGMCNAAAVWLGREPDAPLERIVETLLRLVLDGAAKPGQRKRP